VTPPAACRSARSERNRSDTAYKLAPCPAYQEYLNVPGGGFVHPNYYLNCDTVSQIPAGGAVTYETRLQLPTDLGGTGRRSSAGSCRATSARAQPRSCRSPTDRYNRDGKSQATRCPRRRQKTRT
jgi:hypothetical protein